MKVDNLKPFVILLIITGLLLGAGVLMLSKSYSAMSETETYNDTKTLVNATETTLTKGYVIEITSVGNETYTIHPNNYTASLGRDLSAATITLTEDASNLLYSGGDFYIVYTYKDVANSDASTSLGDTITAVKDIATSWLGLLVTIVMIGIIIIIVVGSFGGKRR